MKELNLTEAFCEVLSGLSLIALLIPLLDLLGVLSLEKWIQFVTANPTIGTLGALFLVAYFLGAGVVDAIGLAVDEIAGRCLPRNPVTSAELNAFWVQVQEHVLRYRDHQWTYYSCYRNLFVMLFPAGICWTILTWQRVGWAGGAAVLAGVAVLEAALFRSMIALLKLYRDITRAVGAAASEP